MKSFKSFVTEAKKYSMKQAIDWFGSDEKDIAWTMSSKKRGEPLFGHWLDMSTGEVVAAKEKNPPKGVKVYKKESVEEEKTYSMKQAMDMMMDNPWGKNKMSKDDIRWYVGRDGKKFWMDNLSGELIPAKESKPPKGVRVYKKESVEEGKFIGDRYHHSIKDKDIPGAYVGRDGEDFISGTERVGRKTEFTIKAIKLGGWPKNLDKDRWLMTPSKGRGKPDELDGDEVRRVIQMYTKKKKMKNEELAGTSTADLAHVSEGKKANLRDLDHDEFMKYGDTNPRGRADPEWNKERKRRYKNDMQRTRRKQMKNEELAGTSTADVVGTGDDVADWKDPKKKKKTKPLTRHFIEVGGKRRKLTK